MRCHQNTTQIWRKNFINADIKPPVLWIYGDDDQIIADESLSDPGYQGKIGYRDGWPGEDMYPPQPMKQQIRHTLSQYRRKTGRFVEIEVPGSGHTPFLEKHKTVYMYLRQFLSGKPMHKSAF